MDRMKQLIEILNKASLAYYQQNREIMTDREYDALYDELVAWKVKQVLCFQILLHRM